LKGGHNSIGIGPHSPQGRSYRTLCGFQLRAVCRAVAAGCRVQCVSLMSASGGALGGSELGATS